MELTEVQLLLFTVSGNRYGIDIDQIAALRNADSTESPLYFAQLMGVHNVTKSACSKQLIIKHTGNRPVLITEPEEVATVSTGSIRPVPAILKKTAGEKGVWGLLPQSQQRVIILVDLYKNLLFMQLTDSIANAKPDRVLQERSNNEK
ncbi:hypothetical protein [Sporomusa aerivorans]|uniref:hypothetical protein n=1 Tax=Sporomusa aerivorans TaxID=204936 RepID=UPI00352A21F1